MFEDMETQETMEVSPIFMRSRYRERIDAHVDALKRAAVGIGADHTLVNIAAPLNEALKDYLTFRQRRG